MSFIEVLLSKLWQKMKKKDKNTKKSAKHHMKNKRLSTHQQTHPNFPIDLVHRSPKNLLRTHTNLFRIH